MKSGLLSINFFTILRTLFLLVKLAFMSALSGLWPQAQQQSALGLSQSATSMRDGRMRPRAHFWFNVQKQSVAEANGGSVAKEPYSDLRTES